MAARVFKLQLYAGAVGLTCQGRSLLPSTAVASSVCKYMAATCASAFAVTEGNRFKGKPNTIYHYNLPLQNTFLVYGHKSWSFKLLGSKVGSGTLFDSFYLGCFTWRIEICQWRVPKHGWRLGGCQLAYQ